MNKLTKLGLITLFHTLAITQIFAQNNMDVEMADGMRASGKIYVVVALILMILIGLFFFLFLLERRMAKLEKDVGLDK